MGGQGRKSTSKHPEEQKFMEFQEMAAREAVGHRLKEPSGTRSQRPDYQQARCYSVDTGEQLKEGVTCWV